MSAKTSDAIVTTDRSAPTTSTRSTLWPRDSATVSSTPTMMMMPSGMLIPNAHRHEKAVVSQPPRSGPTAAIPPIVDPQTAKAIVRSRPRNVALSSDRVAGRIIAPPTPCRNRAAMSSSPVAASAAATDAAAKMTTPTRSIRRLPKRSARLPKTSSSEAKTRV